MENGNVENELISTEKLNELRIPEKIKELLEKLLSVNKTKRICHKEILESSIFDQITNNLEETPQEKSKMKHRLKRLTLTSERNDIQTTIHE